MYLEFYGLREEPFGDTPDPRFLYASPGYQEAQATLEYGIRSGRGFTALIAQPGMGKTTLLFDLLERYAKTARTAFVFLTQCDSREFLRYLMSELEADTGERDIVRLHEQFGQLLAREAQAGRKVIAVVDEAHNLDTSVLETVRLLSDFETPRAKLLHIILAGQPELADRLNAPALLQLRQRISHLVRLEPLSAAEAGRYIEHRLKAAGHSGEALFSEQALAMIVERSQGIPRVINNLCCNALLLGFAKGEKTLGAEVVGEVCADLDFEAITGKPEGAAPAAEEDIAAALTAESGQAMPEWEASEAPAAMAAAAPGDAGYFPSWPDSGAPTETAAAGEASSAELAPADEAATASAQTPAAMETDAPEDMALMDTHTDATEDMLDMSDAALQRMLDEISKHTAATFFPEEGSAELEEPAATAGGNQANGAGEAAKEPVNAERPQDQVEGNGAKEHVDVEALAADCALFGMESPRRWKRPAGTVGKPFSAPGPAMRRNAGRVPRRNGPRAVANPGVGNVARPANAGVSAAQATEAGINPPARGPAGSAGKLWPERAAAAGDKRRGHHQRSLYLAAAGSALLVLVLIWLLSSNAPSATPQSADAGQTAAQTPAQAAPVSEEANDRGAVLDVTEEASGGEAGARETRPAVVMRANHGEELLYRVDPVYPAAARANGIEGPVVLDATISDHGFLRHIRVVKGDPLLADAVLDAVRGWRYRPQMQQGQPVQSETRIVVNFRLVAPGSSPAQKP